MAALRRIFNLFRRNRLAHEIDEELKSHIELRIEANLSRGMTEEEARRDALLRFGNPTIMKERTTGSDTNLFLERLARDLRYALRQLLRSPSFTVTAIITLAFGIATNVIVFAILSSILRNPLHLPEEERLSMISRARTGSDGQSYPTFVDLRDSNRSFRGILAYQVNRGALSADGQQPQSSWYLFASSNYFDVLGVEPQLGRFFHQSDEHGPNSIPYVVLSDSYWKNSFHSDPSLIGKVVQINKHPFTVLGVAKPEFHGTEVFLWPDFWLPMVDQPQIEGYRLLDKRGSNGLRVEGKRNPGVSVEQATADLETIAAKLSKQYPMEAENLHFVLNRPGMFGADIANSIHAFLLAIMALAGLVLATACTNLASLFAARATERSRELAIRLAIGSSRWRIFRQLMTEALLLSCWGGVLGTAISFLVARLLTRWQPFLGMPIRISISPDAMTLLFGLGLSLFSGIFFGLIPAREIWKTDAGAAIRKGESYINFRSFSLRDLLLGLQVTCCTLLLTSSLVSVRSMLRTLHAPIGVQPQGAYLVETDFIGYTDQSAFPIQQKLLKALEDIPEVTAAGTISRAPLRTGSNEQTVYRDGTTDFRSSNAAMTAISNVISPGYLQAAGVRLMQGRNINWNDVKGKPSVLLVNQTFARKLFGKDSPIGKRVYSYSMSQPSEIVGVVEDGKYNSLTEEPHPAIFAPLAQYNESGTNLIIRTQLPAQELNHRLLRIFAQIDPQLPVRVYSWQDAMDLVLFPARIATACLGIMGALAAMLAITGIFGMAAFSVSKRMKELGIRIAVGARPLQIIGAALGRPLLLLAIGCVLGLGLGVATTRFLAMIVYEASAKDPLVLTGVFVLMTMIGLGAATLPARQALGIEPVQLLRED